MNKLLIVAGVVGAVWWFSKREALAADAPRRLGPRGIEQIDVPPGADQDVITLQDIINLSEAWTMQAAGDVAAMSMGMPMPGAHPPVDWFGGELPYTGVIDPATRLHMTKLKSLVAQTGMPVALLHGLGLSRLLMIDVGVESDANLLIDAFSPIEQALMSIGGEGYPATNDGNRIFWDFYARMGRAYLAHAEGT